MKILINDIEYTFEYAEATASIDFICRQFTLIDVSKNMRFDIGDNVKIYDKSNKLFIDADIEYTKKESSDSKISFVYAGRNKAKYIVDSYMDKTIQFSQGQEVQRVLQDICNDFDINIIGNASLPQQEIKTFLIGSKIIENFLEIARDSQKIIHSTAKGNLIIEFQAKEEIEKAFVYGSNLIESYFENNTTKIYDKYTIVSQSNYLAKQVQQENIIGSYGAGSFRKTIVSKSNLTIQEAEEIAKNEHLKDVRNSFFYNAKVNEDVELNKIYFVKDETCNLNEKMNCKEIKLVKSTLDEDYQEYTMCTFEKVV